MQFETIDSAEQLAQLCAIAREQSRIGIDTEFLWEKTYAPQICLVQLRAGGQIGIVDPIAGIDVSPVATLIADPTVEVVMHAPHADLVAFAARFDTIPTNVFDTQLAAGFAGYSAGLSYERLVHATTGAQVKPSESFTDWSRRPLTDNQLTYAAEDVEHLFAMADRIADKLTKLGRLGWAREELARRFEDIGRLVTDPELAWRKVARRGKLSVAELGTLQSAAAWRENIARRRDLPTGWVMKDATLVEIARRRPKDATQLARIRGVDAGVKGVDRDRLLEAVRNAPPADAPSEGAPPPPHVRQRIAIAKGVASSFVRVRCEELKIAPELVATSADIEELISHVALGDAAPAEQPPLLRGWRKELVGTDLVNVLEGKTAIRLTSHKPFLETT